jgi:hypothetical protein
MNKLTIEERKVSDLIPSARNARTHSDAQVAEIAGSIKEFGWTNPVLIDGSDGIIAGHGRVLAARMLKRKTVPCIVLAHLSDAQRRAYMIADNKLALNAGWDDDMLRAELRALAEESFDLTLTGFSADELRDLSVDPHHAEGGSAGANGSTPARDLLGLVNVTIEEPRTKCEDGDCFRLTRDGLAHILHVGSVLDGYETWSASMRAGSRFCPYPGVFVLLSPGAGESHLVLVQPDNYIAGHIVDRFVDVYGQDAAERVS